MELNIATKNFHLNDVLEQYIINGNLLLEKDRAISIVELTLSVKQSMITSKVKNHDIYQGINEVFKKIERQLVKYEEKFRERKRIAQKTRRQ
jgi:ribosomal subunit interface protein